ncbi:DUF460 domain-containing protein [Metallosphaera tengchongensis]|uniref:DUF460 domain-containing protein n=1 Tax=Metallosphaera tengchongensis TaxID=1532350 RepID=A0A6N0NX92_9CREN|nr:DUF460 domain-containing protein [Metallosphaera tengchongensis]QKQ99987.1 DUF460 domain-containing protein [Metallosphaera tengchongensis]
MKVMGIDIEKGSPNSNEQPKYSIVIMDETGNIILKAEEVSRSRIVRLAWEYEVSAIGTDNVYELGSTDKEIISLLSLLPENVEVIQVNVKNGAFMDLKEVAKEYGIDVQGKPTSSRTAYIVASLVLKGAGTKIKFVENRTKIIISKGRRSGPGGMSSNRYKRHLRGLVLRVFKRVKEELDRHNFDYDVVVRRTKAGLESAMFIVYAPRESLYGIVRKMSGHDVNLEIRPIYRDRIEFIDSKKASQRPIIVGLDPGLEFGISVLDMYGNPLLLSTKRGIDRESLIELILEIGSPVIIATDVNPVPDTVRKLGAILRSRIHVPEKSLSVEEKQTILEDISKKYGMHISDPHVRDSLAAAVMAFRDVERKLRHAEGLINRFGIDMDKNNVFRCIIDDNTIAECIEKEIDKKITESKKPEISVQDLKETNQNIQDSNKLNEEIMFLKHELLKMRRILSKVLGEKYELERKIEEIKLFYRKETERDRRVEELKNIIDQKNKEISRLREILSNYDKRASSLEKVIEALISGKVITVRGSFKGMEVRDGKLYYGEWAINNQLALYISNEIAVVDESLIKDLQLLRKELEISKKVDESSLKKLIDEYRSSRTRSLK